MGNYGGSPGNREWKLRHRQHRFANKFENIISTPSAVLFSVLRFTCELTESGTIMSSFAAYA